MKKLLTILFALLVGISFLQAKEVEMQRAKNIGYNFIKAQNKQKLLSNNDLQLCESYRTAQGDAAFYVFNYEQGFVIVSADDRAYPILAYSDESGFEPHDIAPALQEYLLGLVEQIEWAMAEDYHSEEIAQHWKSIENGIIYKAGEKSVTPLLPDTWNQDCYYNDLCPVDANGPCGHCYVGCTSLAMGQIMHYWNYPEHGQGSTSYTPPGYPQQYANFGATTYEWANMPNSLNYNSPQAQRQAVATMLWHVGISMNANYGPNGTSGAPAYVASRLTTYWRYSTDCHGEYKQHYSNTQWIALLKNDLDAGRPIHYSGWTVDNAGHSFVCDGYNSSDQFHFNWGWSGSGNGYYAIGALNVNGYQFNYTNYAVFSIHPIDETQCTITTTASPSNGGTVTGGGNYNIGQTCTVTATANAGYTFVNWTENGTQVSTNANYTFTVNGNRNLVAHFSQQSYTITTSSNPSNGGTTSGGGNYTYGATCTVTASPNTGFVFTKWMQGNTQVSTNASYTFTVNANTHLVAHFEAETYTITVASADPEMGSVTGGGSFTYGQTCGVAALPKPNYQFQNWTENDDIVATNAFFTFTVTSSRHLVANFTPITVEITSETDPISGGTITGTGTYIMGEIVSLEVTPAENYNFLNWTEDGEIVSETMTYTFVAETSRHLVAHLDTDDGINENAAAFHIYPNPAHDQINIEGEGIRKIDIFNALGQLIISKEINTETPIHLDLSEFRNSGALLIRLHTDEGIFSKRIMMQGI